MQKSPFKFLDSYTKDDRCFFFRSGIILEYIISPLQGLNCCMSSSSHWTLSNAQVFCAYSAKKNVHYSVEKGIGTMIGYFHTCNVKSIFLIRSEIAICSKGEKGPLRSRNDAVPP